MGAMVWVSREGRRMQLLYEQLPAATCWVASQLLPVVVEGVVAEGGVLGPGGSQIWES